MKVLSVYGRTIELLIEYGSAVLMKRFGTDYRGPIFLATNYVLGHIVAKANLDNCYRDGCGWGWELGNVERIKEITIKAPKEGLYDLPDEVSKWKQ